MASHHTGNPPQLGATFVPGGFDDYYMPAPPPELVSPAPQRITPEVPEQMQTNLAALELEDNSRSHSPQPQPPPQQQQQPPSQPQQLLQQPAGPEPRSTSIYNSYQSTSAAPPQIPPPNVGQSDMPNFSPFPPVTAKPNVPPSDEEKEQILENARLPVLNSNDPDMQLAWAQDVLAYIATSQLYEERIAIHQPKRSGTPSIEHQLRVDAMNIVTFLAEQHHPKAEFMKGMWLEFGNFGMRQDKREAFRCYMRAAEQGYSRAEYRMGMQFEQGNDPMKALLHYRRGAEAGDSASNYRLGMMTLMGQMGQQQDFAKGIQMLRVAAEHADENAPQGAYVLGMLQVRELPQVQVPEVLLPFDEEAGRLNIEKAAYLGFAKAQLKMGAAFELCSLGCEFDPALSLHYNSLAARQGEAEAEMAISKWFLCGYEGVFPKNEELAYVYAERAAYSGLATAEFAMGYFHEIGMHTPVNLEKAKEWYEKAAKNGNQDAIQRIEGLNQDNALSKKDHEQVAINRIRSQYGSKRGGRPERFKTKVPDLPSVTDEGESEWSNQRPPRSASTAPYPLADEPPAVNRPGSAAPYPLDNGPQPPQHARTEPAGGFFAPQGGPPLNHHRASSGGAPAFHLNPGQHQPPGPQRPATTINDMHDRPSPGPGGWQGGRGYGPPHQVQRPGDMGFQGPGGPRANSLSPRPHPQQGGMQDIGYVAPLQPRRQTPIQGQGPPAPQRPGLQQGPHQGHSQGRPQGGRTGQLQDQGPQRSDSGSSVRPGQQGGLPGRPAPHRPGQQPQPQKPKPQAPMGNGPKTFAEMGIPAQGKDSECVIM